MEEINNRLGNEASSKTEARRHDHNDRLVELLNTGKDTEWLHFWRIGKYSDFPQHMTFRRINGTLYRRLYVAHKDKGTDSKLRKATQLAIVQSIDDKNGKEIGFFTKQGAIEEVDRIGGAIPEIKSVWRTT